MRKTQNVSVTLPGNLIEALNKLQQEENKSFSAIVSEAVKQYCAFKDYEKLVDKFSKAAIKSGIVTEEDIDRAVHEVKRESIKKNKNRS